ncbi:2OG-Fe(II) oxygenase family protein [Nocardia vinacea]|uniref:2OG-Fe(II) oxygenase family protein n=1 Tax=Nocardia vinacea TaxID=96468 RepID=UPI0033E948E5
MGYISDGELGRAVLAGWRTRGYHQIRATTVERDAADAAFAAMRDFFAQPQAAKRALVSELSYSGYIGSGDEITGGKADTPEAFTVCRDLPVSHPAVLAELPCHGPVPWPPGQFRPAAAGLMARLGAVADRVLRAVAAALDDVDALALTRLTVDGWHHMRLMRFPPLVDNRPRGQGAHTDYGMLVLVVQDSVPGLQVRPSVPLADRHRNWVAAESSAGRYDDVAGWTPVDPAPGVLTLLPGDMLQFLTGGRVMASPHKVDLHREPRYSMAYFHEPAFDTVLRPISGPADGEAVHYGLHFTRMFMRSYPDRSTTRRIVAERLLSHLPGSDEHL